MIPHITKQKKPRKKVAKKPGRRVAARSLRRIGACLALQTWRNIYSRGTN
jgi:cell division protein FtsB